MYKELRVIDWLRPNEESVEIDPYVPLKVTWGRWNPRLESYVYWRTGDLKKSMLEVGLVKNSGIIRLITLVMAKGELDANPPARKLAASQQLGNPNIDMLGWPEGAYYDSPGPLQVKLSSDSATILWSHSQPIEVVRSGGRVQFGINQAGGLVMINLVKLTAEEGSSMREALAIGI